MRKTFYFYPVIVAFLVTFSQSQALFSQQEQSESEKSEVHFSRDTSFKNDPTILSVNRLSEIGEIDTNTSLLRAGSSQVHCNCISELGGKDLDEINLIISLDNNYNNSARLYFNRYFSGHPNLSHFRRYFSTIPSNPNPANKQSAGFAARGDNQVPNRFSNLIFQLIKISCSSKYGGSLEYTFDLVETDEYEFTSSNYLYDFREFKFRIYLTPSNTGLNNPGQIYTNLARKFEYEYDLHAIYNKNGNWSQGSYRNASIIDESEEEQSLLELNVALKASVQTILTGIVRDLAAFTGGLIRSINAPIFAQSNVIVDHIQLSDNNMTLRTHNGIKFAHVDMKIMGIDVDTEVGAEEFNIYIWRRLTSNYTKRIASFRGLDQREGTRWFQLDKFPVYASCPAKAYSMEYGLSESDGPINLDDHFDVNGHLLRVACSSMVNLPVNTVVDQGDVTNILIRDRDTHDIKGTLHIAYKVTLRMQ